MRQYEQALKHYEAALAIEREPGHIYGEIMSLANIANLYQKTNQQKEALNYSQDALRLAHQFEMQASLYSNTGALLQSMGYFDDALNHYRMALYLITKLGLKRERAAILNNFWGKTSQQL